MSSRKYPRNEVMSVSNKPMLRRQQILNALKQSPICSPLQLAEMTGVSTETIRKDLDALSANGQIIKVHGGVALAATDTHEIPFDLRVTQHAAEKAAIAKAALQLVVPDDVIILEGCTTNLELARALTANLELLESLVVITNSLPIAALFGSGYMCHKFFFLGGWINPLQYNSHGNQTAAMLEGFHLNKAFLSGAALSDDYVISAYYDDDLLFQRAAMKAAKQTVLMLDHSKFGQSAILAVAPLSEVDYLVSDKRLSTQEHADITKRLDVRWVQAS